MVKQLTKQFKVSVEQKRISQLTNEHSAYFKLILSHQLDNKFNFSTISSKKRSHKQRASMYAALGRFIDRSTKLTITEAEDTYGRKPDTSDGTYDPERNIEVEVVHFCLYKKSDPVNSITDGIRLHGYYRESGYFVVTRLDWYHTKHR